MRGRRYRKRQLVGQKPHQRPEPGWLYYFRRWGDHSVEAIAARRSAMHGDWARTLKEIYSGPISSLVSANNALLARLRR